MTPNALTLEPAVSWPKSGPHIPVALLDFLLRQTAPVSLDTLCSALQLNHTQALHQLQLLADAGCQIQDHPAQGLRLVSSSPTTWHDYLQARLNHHPNRVIEIYQQTASTQDAARRLTTSRPHDADATVVVADHQTAGRGRLGRRWFSPPNSSVILTRVCIIPDAASPDACVNRLTLASALAVAQAVEPLLPNLPVQIKWPNDITVQGRKLAGILVETFPLPGSRNTLAALIGVGINVALEPHQVPDQPPGLRQRITSFAMLGHSTDRLRILADTLAQLDLALAQQNPAPLLDQWRRRSPLLGQKVQLQHRGQIFQGQVVDLHPTAGLIVRTILGTLVHLPVQTTSILS